MAISKKGSRKIVVDNHEFRWRATGSDDWISIVIWPVENENSRLVGSSGYHSNIVKVNEGHYSATDQAVITNRVIRKIIMHFGIDAILKNSSQWNIEEIEKFFNSDNVIRSKYGTS